MSLRVGELTIGFNGRTDRQLDRVLEVQSFTLSVISRLETTMLAQSAALKSALDDMASATDGAVAEIHAELDKITAAVTDDPDIAASIDRVKTLTGKLNDTVSAAKSLSEVQIAGAVPANVVAPSPVPPVADTPTV